MSQEVLAPTLRLLGARENPVGLKSSCWVPAVISTFVGSAFSPGFPTPLAPPLLLVCSLRLEPSSQDWGILTLGVHAAGREPKRPGTGGRTGENRPLWPFGEMGSLKCTAASLPGRAADRALHPYLGCSQESMSHSKPSLSHRGP